MIGWKSLQVTNSSIGWKKVGLLSDTWSPLVETAGTFYMLQACLHDNFFKN